MIWEGDGGSPGVCVFKILNFYVCYSILHVVDDLMLKI